MICKEYGDISNWFLVSLHQTLRNLHGKPKQN